MLCLSSSGRAALTDHAKGKKHDPLKKMSTFFTSAKKLSDKCEKQQALDMCVTKSDTLKAEIIWTLSQL